MKKEMLNESRFGKRLTGIIMVLAIVFYCSFFLFSCVSTPTVGNQEEEIDEGDIVRIVDDKIIKLQRGGVSVTATKDGNLSLYRMAKRENITPVQMLTVGIYLIVFYTDDSSDVMRDNLIMELYDMKAAETSTEFTPVRTTRIPGEFGDSRLYDGETLVFTTKIKKPSKGFLYLRDSILGEKRLKRLVAPFEGTGLFRLNFMNHAGNFETGFFENCETVYFASDAIYPIQRTYYKKGCSYDYEDNLAKVSLKDFSTLAVAEKDKIKIESRRQVLSKDGYVFLLCNYDEGYSYKRSKATLKVYDNDLKLYAEWEPNINNGINGSYYEGGYLYLVTGDEENSIYKIDLSDPSNPAHVGFASTQSFSGSLLPFGEGRLLGIGESLNDHKNLVKISLFDTTGDNPIALFEQTLEGVNFCYDNAAYDYRQIFANADLGIAGFPVEGKGKRNDAAIVRVTEEGATLLAKLSHSQKVANDQSGAGDETRSIFRFAQIDGLIYAISETFVSRCSAIDYSSDAILCTYL